MYLLYVFQFRFLFNLGGTIFLLILLHFQKRIKVAVIFCLGLFEVDLRELLLDRFLLTSDLGNLLLDLMIALFLLVYLSLLFRRTFLLVQISPRQGTLHLNEIPSLILTIANIELRHRGSLDAPDSLLPQLLLLSRFLAISTGATLIVLDIHDRVLLNMMG